MDLFVIERYNGDVSKAEPDASASKSSHLQRLLSKIEEKKRIAAQLALEKEQEEKKKLEKKSLRQKVKAAKYEAKKNERSIKKPEETKLKEKKPKDKKGAGNKLPNSKTIGNFTILGDDNLGGKKSEVEAQLPHWLASPSTFSVDLQNLTVSIDDVPQLDKDLIEKLRSNKVTHFFPVQQQVIPALLEAQGKPLQFWPRDVCVSAPTGSGKTYAFVLPIVQALRHRFVRHVRALIVLPVQDLATQVFKVFQEFTKGITDLKAVCINAKESFEFEQSLLVNYSEANKKHYSCADIVVTTPGRLVDHLKSTNGFSLHHLKYLVIDEADRVLESVQDDWLYHLENHLHPDQTRRVASLTIKDTALRRPPPQKLLFSATLSSDPELLKELNLFQPRLFTSVVVSGSSTEQTEISSFVGKFSTPAEITEQWVLCDPDTKPLYLYSLISEGNWNTVIVFANTIESVHRLAVLMKHLLQDTKGVAEVSSTLTHIEREKILKKLVSGSVNVLVCSDAFSRGIDIPNVDCVISYDVPKHLKTYIHRVGRTGRAGRKGTAVSLLVERQKPKFMKMLKDAEKDATVKEKIVDTSSIKALEDVYKSALTSLKEDIMTEQVIKVKNIRQKKQFKNKSRKVRTSGSEPLLSKRRGVKPTSKVTILKQKYARKLRKVLSK
ncbi:probable ATP-dependent RNA helicase Dbp73D [Thrips palmi]|uniref:ATP-dependent RNA helicase n=1 Tax=Thrips palmi TaxID=161013 RepID=A0A6P8YGE4_THRPL|nr:probable ATP-dependent RNA helicase Dbp73D [Thrips palmi]